MEKILVLFKTHLDVGFTDLSQNIVNQYNENYIPKAIKVAEELQNRGIKEGFIWTTGSWLIAQYLEYADKEKTEELEKAIKNGWLRWHGLPFTTHSEVADKALFEYGINMATKLDKKYGIKSIGAKMTDVPGHTKAIIPLLKKAGVEFLHIGVNPASYALNVPDFFRWKADSGEIINMMYNPGAYGEFTEIPGTGVGVFFAHTGDNLGPTSADDVIKVYDELHKQYPEAEIVAADLNDLAEEVRKIEDTLPVFTNEFGDTWIHGAGTDPKKLSMFRALLRLAKEVDEKSREEMYKYLVMIPEHTWGVDIKTWLHDHDHFTREKLAYARREFDNFKFCESSWEEQRGYVYSAVENISNPEVKAKAKALIEEYKSDYPSFENMKEVIDEITLNGYEIKWDKYGIYALSKDGKESVVSKEHKIGKFHYEVFGDKDVCGFFRGRYGKPPRHYEWWAVEDFMKPGIEEIQPNHYFCDGMIEKAYSDGSKLYLEYTNDKTAKEKYGCPENVCLIVEPKADKVLFDLVWTNKTACRIPEALWIGFDFTSPVTGITKLGTVINPQEVIYGGNRELHATEGEIKFRDITLSTIDAPLLAVEKPSVYGFYNQIPDIKKGVWMNLFNNQWGTNFPQWYDDDARFRFELKF